MDSLSTNCGFLQVSQLQHFKYWQHADILSGTVLPCRRRYLLHDLSACFLPFVDNTVPYVIAGRIAGFQALIYLYLPMRRFILDLKSLLKKRAYQHVLFWLGILGLLTFIYGSGLPDYGLAMGIVAMFLPIHMLYFYLIAYVLVPRYFDQQKYVRFGIWFLLCVVLSTVAFRLLEIFGSDPIVQRAIRKVDSDFVWVKLHGTYWEQFTRPSYLISAFEQTNIFVWIALSVKFFKMWFERKQAATEAELNFLKGQLHPHFLFNTLNNLYALTLTQSPRSPGVVMGLAEILRYMLYEANAELVSLERDIRIVENYMELEKIRYEERLDIHFSINGDLASCRIAPLLILPLVENAFKHGASEQIGQAWINMDLKINHNTLKFKISNSKPDSPAPPDKDRHHASIGLANVRKRLEILYPLAHQLRIIEEEEVFAVILEVELDNRTITQK